MLPISEPIGPTISPEVTKKIIGVECPNLPKCSLFEVITNPSVSYLIKITYCKNRWDLCQRKQFSDARKEIPPNMLPNGAFVVDDK